MTWTWDTSCRKFENFAKFCKFSKSFFRKGISENPTSVEHHQTPPYDRPVHKVDICPDTPLRVLLGVNELEVNSYHHQAMSALL